jgi:uncharacterized protein
MWHDFAVAVALLLVVEGILPFASPRMLRHVLDVMRQMSDTELRIAGFVSMLLGLLLLVLLNHGMS